jgi:hypothetical protein
LGLAARIDIGINKRNSAVPGNYERHSLTVSPVRFLSAVRADYRFIRIGDERELQAITKAVREPLLGWKIVGADSNDLRSGFLKLRIKLLKCPELVSCHP